jgi:hypothetical protein
MDQSGAILLTENDWQPAQLPKNLVANQGAAKTWSG